MRIFRQDNAICIETPAKVNPFLEVVYRREDGFHELDTVMVAVDLCDTLTFRSRRDSQIKLTIADLRLASGTEIGDVSADQNLAGEKNLIVRALRLLGSDLGIEKGCDVKLEKRIPMQAGLGGGSSDAAAALIGGQMLWRQDYDAMLAAKLAAQLGSDVNFFLEGRANVASEFATKKSELSAWLARCSGRGEIVEPFQFDCDSLGWLVITPALGCPTPAVFAALDLHSRKSESIANPAALVAALQRNDAAAVAKLMFNRLSEPAMRVNANLQNFASNLVRQAATIRSGMSGSGSAFVAPIALNQNLPRIAEGLMQKLGCPVYSAQTWRTLSLADQIRCVLDT